MRTTKREETRETGRKSDTAVRERAVQMNLQAILRPGEGSPEVLGYFAPIPASDKSEHS